jgi:hypothetical protein
MSHYEIDHKLLDKFLGHVLDRYKAGDIDVTTAVNRIAFLVATVALPGAKGRPRRSICRTCWRVSSIGRPHDCCASPSDA